MSRQVVLELPEGTFSALRCDAEEMAQELRWARHHADAQWRAQPTASLDPIQPNPRASSVASATLRLSEAIDPGTLNWTDLSLHCNGGSNLLQNGTVTIEMLSSDVFQINGLAAVTSHIGDRELVVDTPGNKDRAGNEGAGSVTNTWQEWMADHRSDQCAIPFPPRSHRGRHEWSACDDSLPFLLETSL